MNYTTIGGVRGFHVGDPAVSDEEAIEIIRTSIDEGVNFMDNAWSYNQNQFVFTPVSYHLL